MKIVHKILFFLLYFLALPLYLFHTTLASTSILGTYLNPNIPNIISNSKCVVHIVLQGQFSEPDFLNYSPLPPKAPIQLTKIKTSVNWTEKNKYSRVSNNERYRTFCRFVIFHSQKPLDAKTLSVWISSFIFSYFKGGIHIRILFQHYFLTTGTKFENFYVIAITSSKIKGDSSTTADEHDFLYSIAKRTSHNPTIVPNFALLSLGVDKNEICVHSPKLSSPSLKNFDCYDLPKGSTSDIFSVFKLVVSHSTLCLQSSFSNLLEDRGLEYEAKITSLNQIKSAGSYIFLRLLGHSLNITANINECPEHGRKLQRIQITREVSAMSSFNDGWSSSLVMVESQNFRFLTCYSNLQIEFWFFAKPFDNSIWMGIGLTIFAVSGVILLFESITERGEKNCVSSWMADCKLFHLFYWTTRILFEQGLEITGPVGKLGGIRILVGCWLLMATILTNGYRSLAIMDLNAPLPAKYPEEFEVSSKHKKIIWQ